MKLKLIQRKPILPGVETFVFDAPPSVKWQPGQYIHYVLDHQDADNRGNERWFTVSNPPYAGHPSITTRFAGSEGSSFKAALKNLQPGDEIEADDPEGDFVVHDPAQHYIFIAAGIGITPYHSIILQLDHDKKPINIDLMYANRDADFPFDDELQAIASRNPNFKIHKFISPKRIGEADIKAISNNLKNPEYYISGPVPMVEDLEKILEGMGIAKAKINIDDFPGYEKI